MSEIPLPPRFKPDCPACKGTGTVWQQHEYYLPPEPIVCDCIEPEFTEINFSNYTEDDVRALQTWALWAFDRIKMLEEGLPMSCAPKDGTTILVEFDDSKALSHVPTVGNRLRLTEYGAWREEGNFKPGRGYCLASWGGAETVDESGEGYGPMAHMPNWWFEADGSFENAVYPVRWWPRNR
jgi:hypothetical protein